MIRIEKLMVKRVTTVDVDDSVLDATKIMNSHNIGCLVVLEKDRVAGILTERDLLKRVLETCRNPDATKVHEVMTSRIVFGSPDMQLTEATRLMFANRIKKLPILEDDMLVGLITLTDVARATRTDEQTMKLIEALSNMHILGETSGNPGVAESAQTVHMKNNRQNK